MSFPNVDLPIGGLGIEVKPGEDRPPIRFTFDAAPGGTWIFQAIGADTVPLVADGNDLVLTLDAAATAAAFAGRHYAIRRDGRTIIEGLVRLAKAEQVIGVTSVAVVLDGFGTASVSVALAGADGADGADGVVQSITAGTNVTVDATDPAHPVVSASGSGETPTGAQAKADAAQAYAIQRGNHTGSQSLDTTTDSASRLAMTTAERTKLGTVAAGATVNATDASLRDRTTHTGLQPESSITGLVADLAAKADAARTITAGTGLTGGGSLAADRTLAVSYGTAAGTAAQGNDARLSDARTPTAHAASHGNAGTDRTTLDASQVTSGVLPIARLATGTPDGSKFVRDDGTLATPSLTPWEVTPALYPRVTGGVSWTTAQSASAYGGYYLRSNASLNDYIRWDVLLGAGTWTFEMYYVTETTGGIATVALDGTTIGTFDTYGATLTWNVKATTTGITVATTGVKELRITMATKNASSSAYKIDLTGLLLRRTA